MDLIKEMYSDIENIDIDFESKTDTKKRQSIEYPYDKTYCTLKNVITSDYEAKNENDFMTFMQGSNDTGNDKPLNDDDPSIIDNTIEDIIEDSNPDEFIQGYIEKLSHCKSNTENTCEAKEKDVDLSTEKSHSCQLSKDEAAAMMLDLIMDPTMENNTDPLIDPEEEERQKLNEMFNNSLIMRARVLNMEIQQAIDNKALVIEHLDESLIAQFDNIIKTSCELLNSGDSYFRHGNVDSANEHLKRAEEIFIQLCPKISNKKFAGENILKHVKPKNYQPADRDKVTVVGNKEDIRKCLQVAEKAMTGRNFEKAKRFLHKAQRIFRTPAAELLLEQIRVIEETQLSLKMIDGDNDDTNTNKTESAENTTDTKEQSEEKESSTKVTEENNVSRNVNPRRPLKRSVCDDPTTVRKRRAISCLAQAKQALSSDDVNAAIKLAKKSQLANPSAEADEFLAKIHNMEDSTTITLEDNKQSNKEDSAEKETEYSDQKKITKTHETHTIKEKIDTKIIKTAVVHRDAIKKEHQANTHVKSKKYSLLRNRTSVNENRKEKPSATKLKLTIEYKTNKSNNSVPDIIELTSDSSDEEFENSVNNRKIGYNKNIEFVDVNKNPGVLKSVLGYAKSLVVGNNEKVDKTSEEASCSKPNNSSYTNYENNAVLKLRFKKVYEQHAYKMIEAGENAMRRSNFKQAENIFKRSQKLYKTQMADTCIEFLHETIDEDSSDECGDEDLRNLNHGDELIVAATSAIKAKDYDFAEMLLKIASVKYSSELAEKLLPVVQKENEHFPHYNKRRYLSVLETLAERYVQIARDMASKELLHNVEDILIIAQNTHPTETAKEMLIGVRRKLYSRNANKLETSHYEWKAHKEAQRGHPITSKSYRSNCYAEIAQRAFFIGEYDTATALLREAHELNPCVEIRHLNLQVKEAGHYMRHPYNRRTRNRFLN